MSCDGCKTSPHTQYIAQIIYIFFVLLDQKIYIFINQKFMIGLDSCARSSLFKTFGPADTNQSSNRMPYCNLKVKVSSSLAFVARYCQGH